MLHHPLGQLLDYVGARDTSLIERLDNASCRVWEIADFDVHRGATVVLLMGGSTPVAAFRTSSVLLHLYKMNVWMTY